MKFYPLSLKDAVMSEAKLSGAKTFKVRVPSKPTPSPEGGVTYVQVELQKCSVWQLLNLDVDDACRFAPIIHLLKILNTYFNEYENKTPLSRKRRM
jgi:hypothetical protein